MLRSNPHPAFAAGVIFCLAAGQALLNSQLRLMDSAWVMPPASQSQKMNPRLYQILTFGNVPAAVDWLLIHFLIDSSEHAQGKLRPPFYYDLDLATDLDPAFYDLYADGANLLDVLHDDFEGARDLLIKGERFRKNELPKYSSEYKAKHWRQEFYLAMLLGYEYIFELHDIPKGAAAFREAAAAPDAPKFVHDIVKRLEKPGGEYEVGIRLLNFMIRDAKTESAKEQLVKKRNSLFLGQYLFQLNASFKEFLQKIPNYRAATSIRPQQMQEYWRKYVRESSVPIQDPFGGHILLDPSGKVVSTTPYQKVMGLE